MSALQGDGIRRVSRAEPLETSLMATCALPVPPRTITFNLIPLSSAQLSDFEQSSLDSKVSLINKRPLERVYIHRRNAGHASLEENGHCSSLVR